MVEARGSFEFSHVDWQYLQDVFGWSTLQYQGWARMELTCHANGPTRVAVFTDYVLEFWIDDEHFFGGDFFGFRRAPTVIPLEPGRHQLDIRLVRDVRSMGAVGVPNHPFVVRFEVCQDFLHADVDKIIFSEMIAGRGFCSPYGSVPLCNNSSEVIRVKGLQSLQVCCD